MGNSVLNSRPSKALTLWPVQTVNSAIQRINHYPVDKCQENPVCLRRGEINPTFSSSLDFKTWQRRF